MQLWRDGFSNVCHPLAFSDSAIEPQEEHIGMCCNDSSTDLEDAEQPATRVTISAGLVDADSTIVCHAHVELKPCRMGPAGRKLATMKRGTSYLLTTPLR